MNTAPGGFLWAILHLHFHNCVENLGGKVSAALSTARGLR